MLALFIYRYQTHFSSAWGSHIPRPSHHPILDCSQYVKGRPGLFYHMNVCLVVARGKGVRQALLFSCKVCPKSGALNTGEVEDCTVVGLVWLARRSD